jgi:hypothetical protein
MVPSLTTSIWYVSGVSLSPRWISVGAALIRNQQTRNLSPHKRAWLLALRRSTDPVRLREQIQVLIDQISALPSASGIPENVRLTLFSREAATAG